MSYTTFPSDARGDRQCILGLWRQNLPTASPDRYEWLYDAGPASSWLVQADAGSPVGAIGLMGRDMKVFDRFCHAGQAIDLNVDGKHRTGGPALSLQRALTAEVQDEQCGLIYGFPNRQSEVILKRVGYRALAEVGRWVKPLCSEETLTAWVPSRAMRRPLSATVDCALLLASPETRYHRSAGLEIAITDRYDARFDALWEAASAQFAVIGQRTAEYLQWRFGRNPQTRHRVLCLSDSGGQLLGYLVYRRDGGTAYVSDFLFREASHLDRLLSEFIRLMRHEGMRRITTVYIGSSLVEQRLIRFGFHRRPSNWTAMVYADKEHFGEDYPRLLDRESWFLTRADIDTDF